jgi:hypothetical protein
MGVSYSRNSIFQNGLGEMIAFRNAAALATRPHPNGIPAFSPRLRARRYLRFKIKIRTTLKGLNPLVPANGCNPVGNLCKSGARLCEPQHVPLQINPLRVTDPRSVSEYATFAEISIGVVIFWKRLSQGSPPTRTTLG